MRRLTSPGPCPPETPSGVYAARLRDEARRRRSRIAFVVRPRVSPTADILFVYPRLPTWRTRTSSCSPTEPRSRRWPVMWASTLSTSADRSLLGRPPSGASPSMTHTLMALEACTRRACARSSTCNPSIDSGPPEAPGEAPLIFYVVDFLEPLGEPYDVVTDDNLIVRASSSWRSIPSSSSRGPIRNMLTDAMLTGLERYLTGGGRLMYLGGDGFYWVTTVDGRQPAYRRLRARRERVRGPGRARPERASTAPREGREGCGVIEGEARPARRNWACRAVGRAGTGGRLRPLRHGRR